MSKFLKIFSFITIFSLAFVPVFAQEYGDNMMEEGEGQHMEEGETMEETTETENGEMTEEGQMEETETMEEDEELSEEEIEEILEESEVLEEEDIENLEDLEGEVVAVTEDEVLIEQADGDIVVVSREVYEEKSGIGGVAIGGYVGRKVESGKVEFASTDSGSEPTITTSSGTYKIPSNIPVTRNGSAVTISDIQENEKVVLVLSKSGEPVALELLGEIEKTSNTLLVGSVIAVIVLILLALIFRKKKPASNPIS